MTREDVLSYLNSCRRPEDIDPLHKWIGTYNLRRIYLLRFFKWLYNPDIDSHPQRNNKNTYLIPSLDRHSRKFGNKLQTHSLNIIYRIYKIRFFPSLLNDPKVPEEDKEKITALLQKPWNPYVRRQSSLTEKSGILKFHTFHQHVGWAPGSQMHLKYTHYFGNESSDDY